ncbi:MAG: amidohydrolase [Porticoccaceae bacterium]|nr:MAG: amidohydrolase [Porticoccaceae bacterium]
MGEAPALNASAFGGRPVIDVDTHLVEPHDLWTRRAPPRLCSRVPRVVERDGRRAWVIDEDKVLLEGATPASVVARDGSKWPGLEFLRHQFEEVHPASWDARARVALMDAMGIHAQVVYPNILGFGGQHAVRVDPELRLACVEIYNDAMAELQAESGERLFPMALLPWWDVERAVAEVERCARLGLKGVNINSDPHLFREEGGDFLPDLGDPHWYPLWEVCEDLGLPVNFHIGASEQSMDFVGQQGWPGLHRDLKAALGGAMLFLNNGRVLGNLILSGLLDRFPRLRFVSVESGIGWIPFLLEAIDYQYAETGANAAHLERRPSEYFATNFYACFWFERRDLTADIRRLGVDNVLFETDFPHPICLYPVDDMDAALAGLSEAEKRKVLAENAAALYRIPLPGGA